MLNDGRGKSYFGLIGQKYWPTGAGFVLSVACFPCSGTEDDVCKVVEAAISLAETESFVVTVSMLTSGISVGDADESTLWSTTFVEGSAKWFKVSVTLSFFLLNISPNFWGCFVAAHLRSLFPMLKWKESMQKIREWQSKDYELMLKLSA